MSEKKRAGTPDENTAAARPEETRARERQANPAAPQQSGESLADPTVAAAAGMSEEAARIAELEQEVASLKDQMLRALAEAENVRRRAERERSDAVKYAAVPLIRDLLGVADNLERALASVPEEAREGPLANLVTGLEMTERELRSVFERHKIERLEPLGQKLNPHEHEAMFEVPDPDSPAGTVVQVVQNGYRLHDRLLRPARVAVAKAAPAQAPQGGAAGEPGEGGADEAGPAGEQPGTKAAPDQPGSRLDTSA